MRMFVDFHLCPPMQDFGQVTEMIHNSSERGYRMISISLPTDIPRVSLAQLRKICADARLDLVTRIDLIPRTANELLNNLRRYRHNFELISVVCLSKSVARQAAKDRRVDLLSFPILDLKRLFFDNAEAELASRAFASLEIDMLPLLVSKGFQRIRLLSSLRKMAAIARKYHVTIIISSGATNHHFIRGPHDFASLACLFGMDPSDALRSLSEYPLAIVKRNREKLRSDYVVQGVRVVRKV